MAVTKTTAITVWTKAAGMCAFEGCRQELVVRDSNDLIGHIAHIVAQSADGPRGDRQYSTAVLDSYENLMLLCPTHHTQVDGEPTTWTIERLRALKQAHESWVHSRLEVGGPWKNNISQLEYINVPRLAILGALHGYRVDLSFLDGKDDLHSMGFELNYILIQMKDLLEKAHLNAIALGSIKTFDRTHEGATLSFEDAFRTKNVPGTDYREHLESLQIGDPEVGPQIYRKVGKWKIVLAIDPRWITTTTAFVDFNSGNHRFAGLCMVKEVNSNRLIVRATPLVIGVPKSPWDATFKN